MRPLVRGFILSLVALTAVAQEPLSRQLTLSEMTQSAGSILHGQVVAARVEPHPQYKNVSTLRLTLNVIDPIYGASGKQISYRLFIPPRFRGGLTPSGEYRVGQELILFMHKESQYGLTSPVGGTQGRFRVERVNGHLLVRNGLNNAGLFNAPAPRTQGTQPTAPNMTAGAVPLDDFVRTVRQLAAAKVTQ